MSMPTKDRNAVAGEAIATRFVVVELTTDLTINDTVTNRSYGVAQDTADNGEEFDCVRRGVTKAVAGAAVSNGDLLQVTTGGKVVTDDGSTSGRYLVGEALEGADADGDVFEIYFDPDTTAQA